MTTRAAAISRYAKLIHTALAAAPLNFDYQGETHETIQVERGVCFAATLSSARGSSADSIDRLLRPASTALQVIDQRRHRRPAYRGLLIYAVLQTLNITAGDNFNREVALRPWAESIANDIARIDWSTNPAAHLPASWGATATAAAWDALALHVAGIIYGDAAWAALAAATLDQFARRQLPTGPFLAAGRADNPETHWFHELVLLHAVASYSIQSPSALLLAAAARSAAFHQAETQPDHATNQPWGLPAFILNPATHPLADQLLHTATALASACGAADSGVTSILLADALYCLRRLTDVSP